MQVYRNEDFTFAYQNNKNFPYIPFHSIWSSFLILSCVRFFHVFFIFLFFFGSYLWTVMTLLCVYSLALIFLLTICIEYTYLYTVVEVWPARQFQVKRGHKCSVWSKYVKNGGCMWYVFFSRLFIRSFIVCSLHCTKTIPMCIINFHRQNRSWFRNYYYFMMLENILCNGLCSVLWD